MIISSVITCKTQYCNNSVQCTPYNRRKGTGHQHLFTTNCRSPFLRRNSSAEDATPNALLKINQYAALPINCITSRTQFPSKDVMDASKGGHFRGPREWPSFEDCKGYITLKQHTLANLTPMVREKLIPMTLISWMTSCDDLF